MAIDLKALDEKIRKLQMIRDLAKDPEMAAIISEFATSETGKKAAPAPAVQSTFVLSDGRIKVRPRRGELLRRVEEAITSAPDNVGSDDLVTYLESNGFEFRAAKPNVAVNEALRTLEERGVVERAGKLDGVRVLWRRKR